MSLDMPAMGQALWSLSDATGLRPEYVLPVLYNESGFNPAITNSIGCVGINQACPNAMPVPAGYASWAASQQMTGLVTPMYKAIIAKYGAIRSATRAYQANFLPATLPTARNLSSPLAIRGSGALIAPGLSNAVVYAANASLDANKDGVITVADLAAKMSAVVKTPAVQAAIAQTYALRPGSSPMNAVYGQDFPWETLNLTDIALVGVGVTAVAAASIALARPELFTRYA
jgi:hypothetical protein